MWRPAGRLSSWWLALSLLAASPRVRTTSALAARPQSFALRSPRPGQPSRYRPSVGSSVSKPAPAQIASRPGQRSQLLRTSLVALCLMTLPACSTLRSKPAAPPVPQCPAVQCLDRALQACSGVEAPPVRTCADAVIVASDALGALLVCQAAHRELTECVQRHNLEVGRAQADR